MLVEGVGIELVVVTGVRIIDVVVGMTGVTGTVGVIGSWFLG